MPEITIIEKSTVSCPTCGADFRICPTGDERILCKCKSETDLEKAFKEEFTDGRN